MFDTYILLETIESVKKFVSIITAYDADFELRSGKYIIDAKSILGIFSIDLSKPVLLRVNTEKENPDKIKEAIKAFEVEIQA